MKMTKEELIEMAKRSGLDMLLEIGGMNKCLEHFAKLVAEKEREECAKIAEWHKQMAFDIRSREQK
jgi:hypothetical protein